MPQRSHMKQCPGCDRFVEPDESACPFCERVFDCAGTCDSSPSRWMSLGRALGTFAGMTAVTACTFAAPQPAYGVPAPDCPDGSADNVPPRCEEPITPRDTTGDTGVDAGDAVDSEADDADETGDTRESETGTEDDTADVSNDGS